MRPVNRIQPVGPVQAYKTYSVASPVETHWRPATCAEVGCEHYQYGWATAVMPDSQDEHTLRTSGRHWTGWEATPDGFRRYMFPPGQPCFRASAHRVLLDRQELFIVAGGDWRGNPTGQVRQHTRPEDWVDDFGTHQQHIADLLQRG